MSEILESSERPLEHMLLVRQPELTGTARQLADMLIQFKKVHIVCSDGWSETVDTRKPIIGDINNGQLTFYTQDGCVSVAINMIVKLQADSMLIQESRITTEAPRIPNIDL